MSDLVSEGQEFRRAIQWISERRQDDPSAPLWKLVDEAAQRFDLSPPQADSLLRLLQEEATAP